MTTIQRHGQCVCAEMGCLAAGDCGGACGCRECKGVCSACGGSGGFNQFNIYQDEVTVPYKVHRWIPCSLCSSKETDDERKLKLAEATVDCQCPCHTDTDPRATCLKRCCPNWTGKVYILDPDNTLGLRVACWNEARADTRYWYGTCYEDEIDPNCQNCQGRNWTPHPDPWLYVRAAWPILPIAEFGQTPHDENILSEVSYAFYKGTDPGLAALRVVAEVVLGKETT